MDTTVILLAGRGPKRIPPEFSDKFPNSLDWILDTFKSSGLENVVIITGKSKVKSSNLTTNLKIINNPFWESSGPLLSLYMAKDVTFKGDCLISYVDVLFRNSLLENLLNQNAYDLSIVTDKDWEERYYRDHESKIKAEKIITNSKNIVIESFRGAYNPNDVVGEFTGLIYIKNNKIMPMFEILDRLVWDSDKKLPKKNMGYGLNNIINELAKEGEKVYSYNVNNGWAEFDKAEDVRRFIFSTKSQALQTLKPFLKGGRILEQVSFKVDDWKKNHSNIIEKIQSKFKEDTIIVRSSSSVEDSLESSYAGSFKSVLGVNKVSVSEISKAVNEVIESYTLGSDTENEIFVQPHISDTLMSGVVFTRDISTGAPYYVLNYSLSGDTDSITSGHDSDQRLEYYFRESSLAIKDKMISDVINCAKELEIISGCDFLDIEFGINKNQELIIFQARPITVKNNFARISISDISKSINSGSIHINGLLKRKENLGGQTTILGDMPDWNPAELIGSNPKPLSSSIFDFLITTDTWRIARGMLGYFNPEPENLMSIICGHPYIDVRNSLNSYCPEKLRPELKEKLVNESLDYLKKNPETHDKLEFEVATTCFSSFIDDKLERWTNFGITESEFKEVRSIYLDHTIEILQGKYFTVKELMNKVENVVVSSKVKEFDRKIINRMNFCKEYGTIPFSALARLAFIGNTFLKSFVRHSVISRQSYDLFTASISTIASEMKDEMEQVNNGEIVLATFLKKYGHLRPGTFDIESYSYSERPDIYFNLNRKKTNINKPNSQGFEFSNREHKNISAFLKESGLKIGTKELLNFITDSFKGREYAKFCFSKGVSEILELILDWGRINGIERENIPYLDLNSLIRYGKTSLSSMEKVKLYEILEINKKKYEINKKIILPGLIFESDDIQNITIRNTRPNFVTSQKVTAPVTLLEDLYSGPNLDGMIVAIKSADPGYDWIFTHSISGLITQYGGAGSHMAIKTAEFAIPAAIGVGEFFNKINVGQTIIIDCEKKLIQTI